MQMIPLQGSDFTQQEIEVFESQHLALLQNLANLVKSKKSLDEQEKTIKGQLELLMDEYCIKSLDCEYMKIGRVEATESTTIDLDALKAREPELYEELLADYPKTTKRKAYVAFKVK